MATIDELSAALVKADAAGNASDAKAFADEIRKMRSSTSLQNQIPLDAGAADRMAAERAQPKKEDSAMGQVLGAVYEPPLAIGSNMLGGMAGHIAGVGKYFTGSNREDSDALARKVSSAIGYQPQSETAKYLTGEIGKGIKRARSFRRTEYI